MPTSANSFSSRRLICDTSNRLGFLRPTRPLSWTPPKSDSTKINTLLARFVVSIVNPQRLSSSRSPFHDRILVYKYNDLPPYQFKLKYFNIDELTPSFFFFPQHLAIWKMWRIVWKLVWSKKKKKIQSKRKDALKKKKKKKETTQEAPDPKQRSAGGQRNKAKKNLAAR